MAMAAHDIRIKRIYDAPARDDGARVLVDRLWPRGIKKEDAALTVWLKDVAPSNELRKWFGHEPARWAEFKKRYDRELNGNGAALAELVALAKRGRVTLLYGAKDTEHNQAVALAEFLKSRG
jgi:uncharacterized protein YeaO (DUF488 family)